MQRLVLIDGNAILHRAFYALPETLTLKDGTPVNAVYGFTSMLLKVVQDLKPTYMICSFDLPKPTFRDELFEDYRAQRPPTPDKLVSQVEMVKEVVRAFGIPIYEVEGYEADDVIGTLTKQASKETIIVTGDRDLLQLVDEHTKLYMPVKGLSQAKLYGPREVEEKYGIKPEQMVDYKALVGDPSDNYPGVKGIGPKTARDLINKYGSLENVYKVVNDKKDIRSYAVVGQKKIAEALKIYEKDALLAKKLAKIVTDVPIELDLGKAELEKLDNSDAEKLFKKLAFKTLWQRVAEMREGSSENNSTKNKSKKKNNRERNDQLSML